MAFARKFGRKIVEEIEEVSSSDCRCRAADDGNARDGHDLQPNAYRKEQ